MQEGLFAAHTPLGALAIESVRRERKRKHVIEDTDDATDEETDVEGEQDEIHLWDESLPADWEPSDYRTPDAEAVQGFLE